MSVRGITPRVNFSAPKKFPSCIRPRDQNRTEFLEGRQAVVEFLRHKWSRELDYRLKKELWGFRNNRMAVKFQYEWHDDSGQWFRSYGNELWEFAPSGLMQRREASINDAIISEADRILR